MSESKKRRVHSSDFKAKVGLEEVRGQKSINEIGQEHNVHPQLVRQWEKEILENVSSLIAEAHTEAAESSIIDKYSKAPTSTPCGEPPLAETPHQGIDESSTGQRRAAVDEDERSLN